MIDGKRVLGVVPARGGSKGLPRKNLREVAGVPLVVHAGRVASAVSAIDRAVVSTDDDEIAEVAQSAGLVAPFRRPQALSGDRISDIDVLEHAIEECERLDGHRYDVVVMLQPTSPLRRVQHVEACLSKLHSEALDSVWTVSPTDSKAHPLKQLVVGKDGGLGYYDERGAGIIARQQLTPLFHRNGICYALTRECVLEQRSILGQRAGAVVTDGHAVSIDTEWDLWLVEQLWQDANVGEAADGAKDGNPPIVGQR